MLQQVHKYNETITVVNASFYPCIFLFLAIFSLQIHAKKAVSKASNFFGIIICFKTQPRIIVLLLLVGPGSRNILGIMTGKGMNIWEFPADLQMSACFPIRNSVCSCFYFCGLSL